MHLPLSARVAAVVAALGLVVACTQSQAADLPAAGSVPTLPVQAIGRPASVLVNE